MRVLRTTPVAEMLHMHSIPSNKERAKAKRDEPEKKLKKAESDKDIYNNKGGKEKRHDRRIHMYHNKGGREKWQDDYYNKGGKERCAALYLNHTKPQREAATRARNLRHGLPVDVSTPNLHQMQY